MFGRASSRVGGDSSRNVAEIPTVCALDGRVPFTVTTHSYCWAMTTDGAAIQAVGLQRTFGDKVAVADVDLSVASGEIYGFLGPNGAGKSTCVRMLATLLAPTGGTASVMGFDVATEAADVRLRIGLALQEAALDDKQTGRELLALQSPRSSTWAQRSMIASAHTPGA